MPSRSQLALLFLIAFAPTGQAQGEDLSHRRQDYAILASNLVPGLSDGTATDQPRMEPAVAEAKERWRVMKLETLETKDPQIKAVSKEAAQAHGQILDLAKSSGDSDVVVDIALALLTQNPTPLIYSLAKEGKKTASRTTQYQAVVQRRRAATFLLPELAGELAGPKFEGKALEIDFDENWFGQGVPDRANLTNMTGKDLTNCTIQIDIRGLDGNWVRNVHFVPQWAVGKKMWADYTSMDPRELASISGTTAIEVQNVAVSIWCDELRAEKQSLHYPGKARDEDRSKQLETVLAFKADYVARPYFESGPCIGVTLQGVTGLPSCRVTVLCHGGNRVDQILEADLKSWAGGTRISLQSRGALSSCPDSLDVKVKLDGGEKEWTRNVKIASRR